MNYCEEKGMSTSKLNKAQRTLYFIAENMKMTKSISEEGYEHFQQAIKALEQEPCEDCISRQYVIEKLNGINGTSELDKSFEIVENAPPVIPQEPKTGHWTYDYELIKQLKERGLLADTWRYKDFLVYRK